MNNKKYIGYDELIKLKAYEKLDTTNLNFSGAPNCKIQLYKIKSGEWHQNFRLEMPKGAKWESHFHDCEENILIFKGKVLETKSGKKLERMTPYKINKYDKHSLLALEDCEIYIEFKNPRK